MLYLILILAFLGFTYFGKSLLSALRWACVVATLGFSLFVAQPVYRMQVLGEPPGEAIGNSKFLPMAAQFIPYLNISNAIWRSPGAGTYAGPCVHYTHYQQKLMNLFGVKSTALTGYGHSALRYEEGGRTYMTDNGYWYREIREIGNRNWSPEGRATLYEVPGEPNPIFPYYFPLGMLALIGLSSLLEAMIFSGKTIRAPFQSRGRIKVLPRMTEYDYRKERGNVIVSREGESLVLAPSEVRLLEDAPDMFFTKTWDIFNFFAEAKSGIVRLRPAWIARFEVRWTFRWGDG